MVIQVMGENWTVFLNFCRYLYSDIILNKIIIKLTYKCFANKQIDIFYYIAENIYKKIKESIINMLCFIFFRFLPLFKKKLKRFWNQCIGKISVLIGVCIY